MVVDLKVEGVDQLSRVTKALWRSGEKDLRIELYKAINRSVKPLTDDLRRQLRTFLPDRYADELYESLRIKTRRATGRDAGVRLKASAKTARVRARKARGRRAARPSSGGKERDLASLNRGRLRHPLYGNRGYWYDQAVKPGFWDKPLEAGADQVRRELIQVIDAVGKKLDAEIRGK